MSARGMVDPIDEFLQACPALAAADDLLSREWSGERPPDTTRLGEYGATFAHLFWKLSAAELDAVAALVERWMTSDNQQLIDLAATGFIEALAATAFETGTVEQVAAVLHPRSREHFRVWLSPDDL